MQLRIEHEFYYSDLWSPAFDLRILLRTIAVIVPPTPTDGRPADSPAVAGVPQ